MTINQEQKADIGNRYLEEINRRIAIRNKAKSELPQEVSMRRKEVIDNGNADIKSLGVDTGGFKLQEVEFNDYKDKTIDFICGKLRINGVPLAQCKNLDVLLRPQILAKKTRAAICQELEFLDDRKSGGSVGEFQSYVSRLVTLKKGESVPDGAFKRFIDDYLASKRNFTCSL